MIVSIHALFSKNGKIGSKIISKVSHHLAPSQPDTSHVALLVNSRWVHESTLDAGVQICSIDEWLKHHTEVARVELPEMEYQKLADLFRNLKGKKYDMMGLAYLSICMIPTFIGRKLPKINKWQSNNRFFCCEVLGYLTNKDYSMHTPNMILRDLK